jgi:3-oxoacyl-[acyl-carrier-protein] synthase III
MPNATITAVAGYAPDKVLSNADLEKIMDTNDEWIRSRTGIAERRVLPENEAVSHIGVRVVEQLLEKSGSKASEIELLICATCTGDYILPDTANNICYKSGLNNAFGFDLSAACSGFLFALHTASQFIKCGTYKKIIVIGAEKMTSYMNYEDRATSILFGDGGGGVLLEPGDEFGVIDAVLKGDGIGCQMLRVEAGGSLNPMNQERLDAKQGYVTQDGKQVFKRAVMGMSSTVNEVLERNKITSDQIDWLVPHQANERIILSVADSLNFPMEKVMLNISRYGNTSAGTIPLCLAEYEGQLKKGDNIILTAFGGGFTWGSLYLKWAY